MTKPVVVVGSINLDLVAGANRIPAPGETIIGNTFSTFYGGKGANQAVAAAKLGYSVAMVGCVGDDAFGPQLKHALGEAGVNTEHVATVPGASGVALIITGLKGENSIVVVPAANSKLTPLLLEKNASILKAAGILLAQLEIPLDTVEFLADFADKNSIPLILDPAPARELPVALLKKVTWITPNESETMTLLGKKGAELGQDAAAQAADAFLSYGVRNVVLKLGARGCLVAEAGRAKEYVPAFKVHAVDTTAAGDAFNGAFAVGLMRGYSAKDSAVFASAVAGICVTRPGAQPSMPTEQEVETFLKEHRNSASAI
jgi:ribokinase